MVMKQSIKTKFLKSFLSVLIISLLLCIVLAEIGMVILRESAVSSNIEANIKTAKNSELLLTEQAINSANEFVAAKSNTINFQLQGIQKSVDMMADYLTNMLNNANECKMDNDILNVFDYRQKYIDEGVLAEREKNPEYTLHWVASNIKLYNSDEKVKLETDKQLRLLHNAKGLFASVSASYKNIATIYLTGVGINSENPNASSDNDQRDNYYNIGYDKVMLTKLSALNQYYGTTNQTSGNLPDFRTRDWYVQAVNSGKLFVSENAYDDSFGRGQIITMSKAYYENGKVKGVLCVDMQIDEINSDILQTSIGKSGYALLCHKNENIINFIAAPKLSSEVEDYISNLDKNDPNYYFKMQTALAKFHFGNNYEDIIKSLNSNNDYCENTIHDKDVFIINKSIPITNWIVVVIMPKQEILEKANLSTATITKIMQESIKKMDGAILLINIVLIFVFIAIIICVILIAKKTTRKVTDPITQLNKDVRRIGSGILDYVSNIKTGDEIEMLSNTFENMTKSLRNYINDLNTITADKERIATELNVAKQIQASMLPCIFPPFPDKKEFDIYASMQPAKEVGGDFYDFFLVDKSHLGIIIADVSGKGVPAALFMVIAKTLIKNHAQSGISPAEVFTATNAQLCENNDATMFVTAWMGLIEINTGKVTYVNAGHNPPLIKKNNRFSYLKCKPGFILAGLQGFEYKQEELILDKGDQLFLYTDGVTESTNAQNQLFGDNRLLDILNLNLEKSVTQILPIVKNEIEVFIEDAPQFDDITMLCIEYKGLLK